MTETGNSGSVIIRGDIKALMEELERIKFFGELVLSYRDGKIGLIRKNETIVVKEVK